MKIYIMYVSENNVTGQYIRYFLAMGENCVKAAEKLVEKYEIDMDAISVGQGIPCENINDGWEVKTDIGVYLK